MIEAIKLASALALVLVSGCAHGNHVSHVSPPNEDGSRGSCVREAKGHGWRVCAASSGASYGLIGEVSP